MLQKNIKVAALHSEKNNLKIKYFQSSPEQIKEKEKFDIILNLEIVEHVDDLNLYLSSCQKLLKKKLMFTATINRTFTSYKSNSRGRIHLNIANWYARLE